MKFEILKIERNYKYIESAILNYSSKLKTVMSPKDVDKFNIYKKEVVIKQKSKIMEDNSKKLNNLILQKYNVFNYSERQLTEQDSFALNRGINFSLPPKLVDKELFFLEF